MVRPTVLLFIAPLAASVVHLAQASAAAESQQLPTGISDLLAAMPTMLSAVAAPLDPHDTKKATKTLGAGNTVTIADSQIVFARADEQTLVQTIESMIENSGEPSEAGDRQLTQMILATLGVDGSEREADVAKQVETVLECRADKEKIRECVEELVSEAVRGDD